MKVIGLTGSIASGKSSVSDLLKKLGAFVIDADLVAREIINPGTEAWEEIVSYFGKGILNKNKTINRKALGDIVFSDKRKLEVLNKITHPKIIKKIDRIIEKEKKKSKYKIIVIDAALLIEVGMDKMVDEIWVVTVDEKQQILRLIEREENLTKEQAIERINAQLSNLDKIKLANRIIDNSKDFTETKKQVLKIWEDILAENDI